MNTLRQAIRQACVLMLAACVPALPAALITWPQWHEGATSEGEISIAGALEQQTPLWIDARSASDYALNHVPSAVLLNEDQWQTLLPTVLEKWEPGQVAIVYCSSRSCKASRDVAERLRQYNLGRVYVLKGGWETWKGR